MSEEIRQQALIDSILALRQLGLRLGWLRDSTKRPPLSAWALAFDQVAAQAYSGDRRAREALLVLCIFLVQERGQPLLDALREEATRGHHFNIERLLRTEDLTEKGRRRDERIPDYGTGRELTVGERRSLARRPSRVQLEKLLGDPHPLVLDQLFGCPSLTESDVLRVLSKRPVSPAAIESVCKHPHWLARRLVRTTLIQNPGTPQSVAMPLVATVPRSDLSSIIKTTTLSAHIRSAAHELYQRLPPIEPESLELQ